MENQRRATILIVDDKAANTYALEQLLESKDRRILSVSSGKEALKTVLNQEIDLIILDVQMPDMDGFEVTQILKTNKRSKNIPIIFTSAENTAHEWLMKGFEEGGIDYLFKPIDPEVTKAKVAVLLQLYLQKKELMEKNQRLERYDLLINNSADIICILNARTLRFEEVNQALGNLLDIDVKKIQGTSLLDYLTKEGKEEIRKYIDNRKEKFSFETQIYDKNRRIKWLNWNIISKNELWFANARDITSIRETEEIKNYLAIVVKQSNEAIYMYNPQGRIISWNKGAERIYGFSEEEALKMNIWNIVPEHLMEETQSIINKLLEDKEVKIQETKRTTKFGKIIHVMFSASVITGADGELESVAITEHDITAQKQAENEIRQLNSDLKSNLAQLELSNKELEAFSYSVSHDLRAPLYFIKNLIKMIMEDYQRTFDDRLSRLFAHISGNADKMENLIEDLLEFSRSGRNELNKSKIDFNQLVEKVIAHLQPENDGFIEVKKLHDTVGDPSLLFQVFVNLISNAIKYSGKRTDPNVTIGSTLSGEEVVFYVKDNGDGFDMKDADKLFTAFQRLHSEEEFQGTGVGLALVKRIVVRHGGRVWAEGRKGHGATFYFSLPQASANP